MRITSFEAILEKHEQNPGDIINHGGERTREQKRLRLPKSIVLARRDDWVGFTQMGIQYTHGHVAES